MVEQSVYIVFASYYKHGQVNAAMFTSDKALRDAALDNYYSRYEYRKYLDREEDWGILKK